AERLVVQRGHLEDAEAVDGGLASELVRARERSLPCIVQVVLESTAVLLRKLASGLAQDMPPRYRATSTSASSVPLRQRARIRWAARGGGPAPGTAASNPR